MNKSVKKEWKAEIRVVQYNKSLIPKNSGYFIKIL